MASSLNPGIEVERIREFYPPSEEYLNATRTAEEISDRIDELKRQKDSFDPVSQFVGMKRLGSSYSVAEPFAFFDGATHEDGKLYRVLIGGLLGFATVAISGLAHASTNRPALLGIARGVLASPFVFFGTGWLYDKAQIRHANRQKIYFHYALMHEKNLPRIQRKKYGELIQNWWPHRSLNNFGQAQAKWFD